MNGQIIRDLSNEEYHTSPEWRDYVSSTQLKLIAKSPKAFRYALDNPQEQTDAQRFGSLFHDLMACLAMHNGDWGRGYGVWLEGLAKFDPPINERTGQPYGSTTKAYRDALFDFQMQNVGATIVNPVDSDLASDMAHSLLNDCGETSKQVRKLLKMGEPEISHFVEYEGCKFKWRPDLQSRRKIVDWKTVNTDDLSEKSINSIIARYGYDVSAAHYQYFEHEQSGVWKEFYWVFISKTAPFDAVMVDASEWAYKYDEKYDIVTPGAGAIKFHRLLDLCVKCKKEDYWPGAEINIPVDGYGKRIMIPTPPPWEVNNVANEM